MAGASNEVTNTNYTRKSIIDSDIGVYTVDDANDLIPLSLPLQTYTSIAAGDSWRKLLVCYDSDTTGGTDANIVPVTAHDLLISGAAMVPNGNNILIDLSAGWLDAI